MAGYRKKVVRKYRNLSLNHYLYVFCIQNLDNDIAIVKIRGNTYESPLTFLFIDPFFIYYYRHMY